MTVNTREFWTAEK